MCLKRLLRGTRTAVIRRSMAAMARLELLSFLLWAVCLSGVAVSSGMDLQKRIINSADCGITERLYHVRLKSTDGRSTSHCGGSLIDKEWILTAAHCWKDSWEMFALVNIHPDERNHRKIKIEDRDHHIFEDPKGKIHDIMLLNLSKNPEVKLSTISLPADCTKEKNPQPQPGEIVRVGGFGRCVLNPDGTYDRSCRPDKLQCANMTVEDCSKDPVSKTYPHIPKENWICANGSSVTAPGDSGGGVEFEGKLHGVVSRGPKIVFQGQYKFMRVCKYITWINSFINP